MSVTMPRWPNCCNALGSCARVGLEEAIQHAIERARASQHRQRVQRGQLWGIFAIRPIP